MSRYSYFYLFIFSLRFEKGNQIYSSIINLLHILWQLFFPGSDTGATQVGDMDPCPATWPNLSDLIGWSQQVSSTSWDNNNPASYLGLSLAHLCQRNIPMYAKQREWKMTKDISCSTRKLSVSLLSYIRQNLAIVISLRLQGPYLSLSQIEYNHIYIYISNEILLL